MGSHMGSVWGHRPATHLDLLQLHLLGHAALLFFGLRVDHLVRREQLSVDQSVAAARPGGRGSTSTAAASPSSRAGS
eukprot:7381290-Prymnesium_polylepis.1